MGTRSGFGERVHDSEDPFKQYEGQFIIIGNPADTFRGGKVTKMLHEGFLLKPYIFNAPDGFELREPARDYFIANSLLTEIMPTTQEDLEELIRQINTKRHGVDKNGSKRRILRPGDVSMIIDPYSAPFGLRLPQGSGYLRALRKDFNA